MRDHNNTYDTAVTSRIMQLYNIKYAYIVGEVTSNSRDPEKIVEGSQTSLSKLISEMHGLKTFENILLSK